MAILGLFSEGRPRGSLRTPAGKPCREEPEACADVRRDAWPEPLIGAPRVAGRGEPLAARRACDLPVRGPPALITVIDTEEAFDWAGPLDPASRSVDHMAAIHRVQDIFDAQGLVPCYLVSYPIVAQETGFRPLARYVEAGRALVGAHLNPWVTPPQREPVGPESSYPGNLPGDLEAAKLAELAAQIQRALGVRPTLYKAGRHGKGPSTEAILEAQGFEVDLSLAPPMDYRADGGPDYRHESSRPFWFGRARRLLCLPSTGAFVGAAAALGPALQPLLEHRRIAALRPVAIASRLRLLARLRLTPEGFALAEMMRLTRALLARGQRTFVLSFHSPSVVPGNTPYVRSDADLEAFLARLRGFLAWFQGDLHGRFVTPHALKAELERLAPG
jgi:hypothetical protein